MKKRTPAITASPLLALLALLLCSCGQSGKKTDAPIRFAYQNRVGSAIPIIADERGLFAEHGLDVKASRFNSGPACSEALFTAAVDIGAMGDTTSIIAMSRGTPLRIITSHAAGEHRHRLIVAATSSYQSIHDLVGKRIGIKKGTSTYGGFLKFLDANGIARDRIDVVNLKPSMMPEALASGSVEAFAASEPTPSMGEMRGGRQLATFGGLGNTYPIMMLASERLIRERPDDLQKFLAALQAAAEIIEHDRTAAVAIIAKATGLPPDITAKAMDRHSYRLGLEESTLRSLRETAEFLRQQNVIKAVPELKVLATNP